MPQNPFEEFGGTQIDTTQSNKDPFAEFGGSSLTSTASPEEQTPQAPTAPQVQSPGITNVNIFEQALNEIKAFNTTVPDSITPQHPKVQGLGGLFTQGQPFKSEDELQSQQSDSFVNKTSLDYNGVGGSTYTPEVDPSKVPSQPVVSQQQQQQVSESLAQHPLTDNLQWSAGNVSGTNTSSPASQEQNVVADANKNITQFASGNNQDILAVLPKQEEINAIYSSQNPINPIKTKDELLATAGDKAGKIFQIDALKYYQKANPKIFSDLNRKFNDGSISQQEMYELDSQGLSINQKLYFDNVKKLEPIIEQKASTMTQDELDKDTDVITYKKNIDALNGLNDYQKTMLIKYPDVQKDIQRQQEADAEWEQATHGGLPWIKDAGKTLWNSALSSSISIAKTISKASNAVGATTDEQLNYSLNDLDKQLHEESFALTKLDKGILQAPIDAFIGALPMLATFAATEGAGTAMGLSEGMGTVAASVGTTYGDLYDSAMKTKQLTKEQADLYAALGSITQGVLFSHLPKLGGILGNGELSTASKFGTNEIISSLKNGDGVFSAIQKGATKYGSAAAKMLESGAKGAGVMTGVGLSNQLINLTGNITAGKDVFGVDISPKKMFDDFVINTIAFAPLGIGEYKNELSRRNGLSDYTKYMVGKNPEYYKMMVDRNLQLGKLSIEQSNNAIQNISKIKNAYDKIAKQLSDKQKQQIIPLMMQKDDLIEEKKTLDDTQHEVIDQKIDDIKEDIHDLTVGTPVDLVVPKPMAGRNMTTSLETIGDVVGRDAEYKGELGTISKDDEGNFVFKVGDKETILPVKDKNNPVEKLTDLDIKVTPDSIPENKLPTIVKQGDTQFRNRKYFVSFTSDVNDPVGSRVFEYTKNGNLLPVGKPAKVKAILEQFRNENEISTVHQPYQLNEPKPTTDATTIRSDEGQVQQDNVPVSSEAQGGENLQQPASQETVNADTQQQTGQVKPNEGDTIVIPGQKVGGVQFGEQTMIWSNDGWKKKVGNTIIPVLPDVQKQAQDAYDIKNPQPVVESKPLTLFHGSKKDGKPEVTEVSKSFTNVLTIDNTVEGWLQERADAGDKKAQAMLDSGNKYMESQPYIQELFGEHDAVQFTNKGKNKKGDFPSEYFDIKEGRFYSTDAKHAEVAYATSDRSAKYEKPKEEVKPLTTEEYTAEKKKLDNEYAAAYDKLPDDVDSAELDAEFEDKYSALENRKPKEEVVENKEEPVKPNESWGDQAVEAYRKANPGANPEGAKSSGLSGDEKIIKAAANVAQEVWKTTSSVAKAVKAFLAHLNDKYPAWYGKRKNTMKEYAEKLFSEIAAKEKDEANTTRGMLEQEKLNAAEIEKLQARHEKQLSRLGEFNTAQRDKAIERQAKEMEALKKRQPYTQAQLDKAAKFEGAMSALGAEIFGKQEGRKEGRKEQAKDAAGIAKRISDFIKEQEVNGTISPTQAKALAKRAASVGTSEFRYGNFVKYAKKVFADANYASEIEKANEFAKKLKKNSKSYKTLVNNIDVANALSRIPVEDLNNPSEYNKIAEEYLNSQRSPSHEKYQPFDNSIAEKYLEKVQKELDDKFVKSIEKKYDMAGLTKEEAESVDKFMQAEDGDKYLQNLSEAKQKEVRDKLQSIAEYSQMGIDDAAFNDLSSRSKEWAAVLKNADLSKLNPSLLKDFIKTVDNAIINNTSANLGNVAARIKGVEAAGELSKIPDIKVLDINAFENVYHTLPQLMKKVFGNANIVSKIRLLSGMDGVFNGGTKTNKAVEGVDVEWKKFKKENNVSSNGENVVRRAIYADIIQHSGGSPEDIATRFENNKNKIEQSIALNKSIKSKVELGDVAEKVFNDFRDLKTIDDVNKMMDSKYPSDKKGVEYWQNVFDKNKDALKENTESVFNEKFDEEHNYTPKTIRLLNKALKIDEGGFESFQRRDVPFKPKQSPTTIKRSNSARLPDGWAVDFDFDINMLNKFQQGVYDLNTSESRLQFNEFMKTPEAIKLFGGIDNANKISKVFNDSESFQRNAGRHNDDVGKIINDITTTFRNISTTMTLGGFTQWVKQYPSVMLGAAVRLGSDAPLLLESFKFKKDNPIFDNFTISERAAREGGYDRGERLHNRLNKKIGESVVGKVGGFINDASYATKRIMFASLREGDVAAAKRSWIAYYLQSLKKQGIDISKIDPATEHEKINEPERKLAAAYAEQAVKETQIPSNPAELSQLQRASGDAGTRTLKDIFMPFSTFSSNMRARMMNDVIRLKNGSDADRVEASKDLAANITETIAYHAISKGLIYGLLYYGGSKLIHSATGLGNNPDDDKDRVGKLVKQGYSDAMSDIFASGFGNVVQNNFIDLANLSAYALKKSMGSNDVDGKSADDYVYNKDNSQTFSRYRGDSSPFGLYGILFNKLNDYKSDVQANITGKYPKEYYGNTSYKDLSDKEQNYITFMTLMDMMSLIGANDADVMRMLNHTKSDITSGSESGSSHFNINDLPKAAKAGYLKSQALMNKAKAMQNKQGSSVIKILNQHN